MKRTINFQRLVAWVAVGVGLTGFPLRSAPAAKPLYENNFEKATAGSVPDDFLVLDGSFAVKQDGDNKFFELAGAPVDSYGALFGPTEKDGVAVSARIRSTARKRRFPSFGVGLEGAGGYKLQISPAKDAIEISRNDDVKAKAPYQWESGKWTELRLRVWKIKNGTWKVEGKAWTEGNGEPKDWNVSVEANDEPPAGRAAIWGAPYAGTPIQYDDLVVTAAP